MNITAKELSGNHIGKWANFTTRWGQHAGKITRIDNNPDGTPRGITLDNFLYVPIGPDTPITIQEGQ